MRRWLILAAIVIAFVGATGYLLSQSTQARADLQTQAPATIAVTRGNVQQAVTADAKLVDVRKATLSMNVGGQLSTIKVRPGDRVQAGEVLATLDTTELERQVARAEQAYLLQQATYSATLQPDPQTVAAARAAVDSAQAAYAAAQQKSATSQDQITVACFNVQNAADALGRARDAYQAIASDLRGWIQAEIEARRAAYQTAQNAYAAEVAKCDLARNSVNDSSVRSAQANLLAAEAPGEVANGSVVNVGAGERTSLLDLIRLLEGITGRTLAYRRLPARAGDVHDSQASLERAERLLGYRPQVSLAEGLRRTWAWFEPRPAAAARSVPGRTRASAASRCPRWAAKCASSACAEPASLSRSCRVDRSSCAGGEAANGSNLIRGDPVVPSRICFRRLACRRGSATACHCCSAARTWSGRPGSASTSAISPRPEALGWCRNGVPASTQLIEFTRFGTVP